MNRTRMFLLGCAALYAASVVTALGAGADAGVGACVDGTGTSLTLADPTVQGFVGVNYGDSSETGVFDDQTEYETQCCAETGEEPDCFEPVE